MPTKGRNEWLSLRSFTILQRALIVRKKKKKEFMEIRMENK